MSSLPSVVSVWAPRGETIVLRSGEVVTDAGNYVPLSAEVINKVMRGELLNAGPTAYVAETVLSPANVQSIDSYVAQSITSSGNGAVLCKEAATAIASVAPTADGAIAYARGRAAVGDGGHGHFVWNGASRAAIDGGLVMGDPLKPGRWERMRVSREVNVKWYGAMGDGVHDDTDAFYAAMMAVAPYSWGAEVFVPAGDYKITRTLKWGPNTAPLANGRFRGEAGGNKSFGSANLWWHGPTLNASGFSTAASSFEPLTNKSILFQLESFDTIVEGICFRVAPGHGCGALVNLGYDQGKVVNAINQNQFWNCSFNGGRALADGTADYCIVWDYWKNVEDQNTEDCRIVDCALGGAVQAAVWFRLNTQPYGTVFERCFMINSLMVDPSTPGFTGNEPYGIAFKNDTLSLSLTVSNCDIQRFAAVFYVTTHPQCIKVVNCHAEATKKVWYSATGASQDLCVVSFDAGRYTPDGFGVQSYGPGTTWGPSDYDVFNFRGDHPISIQNCVFHANYERLPFKIHTMGNDLTSINNRYPNDDPFWQNYGPLDASHVGRTFSMGDSGTNASGAVVTLPTLRGCSNGGGTVTISGASTSADVVFAHPERHQTAYQGALAQSYQVALSVQTVTGSPTVTAPYLSSRLHTGFTITLPTAPGIGNSIAVAYEPWRP